MEKTAIQIVTELYPEAKFKYDEVTKTVTLEIKGETFEGTARNEKEAKSVACRAALLKFCQLPDHAALIKDKGESYQWPILPQTHADEIGKMVNEKFAELIEMMSDAPNPDCTVVAGIVQTRGQDAKLICVTTGTKCISLKNMSNGGEVLNDQHAEVLARRCLCKYLYQQLALRMTDAGDESIFKRAKNGGYRLKKGIAFDLYVSKPPCGDASYFPPPKHVELEKQYPGKVLRPLLRAKFEAGEDSTPVKNKYLDGRLWTMTCSDKIAKWNVVGVQGALLSHLIQPIYLRSIVLGSPLKLDHVYRALSGRIEKTITGPRSPYRLNHLLMNCVTSPVVEQSGNPPDYCINWITGQDKPEMIDYATGKDCAGNPSQISKLKLFEEFCDVRDQISVPQIDICNCDKIKYQLKNRYCDGKKWAYAYSSAKREMKHAFAVAGLGNWIEKPDNRDQFELPGGYVPNGIHLQWSLDPRRIILNITG